jgi:hypothetical protein
VCRTGTIETKGVWKEGMKNGTKKERTNETGRNK